MQLAWWHQACKIRLLLRARLEVALGCPTVTAGEDVHPRGPESLAERQTWELHNGK